MNATMKMPVVLLVLLSLFSWAHSNEEDIAPQQWIDQKLSVTLPAPYGKSVVSIKVSSSTPTKITSLSVASESGELITVSSQALISIVNPQIQTLHVSYGPDYNGVLSVVLRVRFGKADSNGQFPLALIRIQDLVARDVVVQKSNGRREDTIKIESFEK